MLSQRNDNFGEKKNMGNAWFNLTCNHPLQEYPTLRQGERDLPIAYTHQLESLLTALIVIDIYLGVSRVGIIPPFWGIKRVLTKLSLIEKCPHCGDVGRKGFRYLIAGSSCRPQS